VSETAETAINKVKYKGEMASVECQFEYLMINPEACSKKTAARKYTINEAELPMNVAIHRALRKFVRLF
jgi:hypothetical protein